MKDYRPMEDYACDDADGRNSYDNEHNMAYTGCPMSLNRTRKLGYRPGAPARSSPTGELARLPLIIVDC